MSLARSAAVALTTSAMAVLAFASAAPANADEPNIYMSVAKEAAGDQTLFYASWHKAGFEVSDQMALDQCDHRPECTGFAQVANGCVAIAKHSGVGIFEHGIAPNKGAAEHLALAKANGAKSIPEMLTTGSAQRAPGVLVGTYCTPNVA